MTKWVVLDLGETLIDETRCWREWAQYLGVPEFTFFGAFGATIADRRPHSDVFDLIRPGFEFERDRKLKVESGLPWLPGLQDLYADALPGLQALRKAGYNLAVMANQPIDVEALLAALPIDAYATSDRWGVAKPDPAFFVRVASELKAQPSDIAYVGDRIDNDVLPAKAAGMTAIHIRRGPWGIIQSTWPEASESDARIDSLLQLPHVLQELGMRPEAE